MTNRLWGAYYVRLANDAWEVTSECDDDELFVGHVPTRELAQTMCDTINNWIATGDEPTSGLGESG